MNLSHGARQCLNVLRTYGRSVFPKQETLARRLKCGLRTVNRYIAELRRAGLIEVSQRGPTSSQYRVVYQTIADRNGVACPIPLAAEEGAQKPVENLWTEVQNGVAFGVASPADHYYLGKPEQTVAEPSDYDFPIQRKNQPRKKPPDFEWSMQLLAVAKSIGRRAP